MKNKKLNLKRLMLTVLLLVILVAIDQLSKQWAASVLKDRPLVIIKNVFELYYLENHGAAFSMLQGAQIFFIVITAAFLIIGTCILIKTPSERHYLMLRGCLIFIMAGAVGNLIDRLVFNYVRDFFYIKLINFPVFNVADICVSVAVVILAILILFYYKNEDFAFLSKKKNSSEEKSSDDE